jgi:hypothetical protein
LLLLLLVVLVVLVVMVLLLLRLLLLSDFILTQTWAISFSKDGNRFDSVPVFKKLF